MNSIVFKMCFALTLALLSASLSAYQKPSYGPGQVRLDLADEAADFQEIAIEDQSGTYVDLQGLRFRDEQGQEKPLGDFFRSGKPVVMAMVYYECPSLCGVLMNGVVNALRRLDWRIHQDFDVIFVSIDHDEGPELATWKKENYLKDYGDLMAGAGWHFLTGTEDNIRALASQLGFGFKYMPDVNEYAHSAGFFLLSDQGQISRTLYGVEFEPRDVRLALLEASEGRIGTVVDKLLLYCYRFDPNSKGYALHAMNMVRAGGALTLLILAIYLIVFWRRQIKGSQKEA